MWLVVVKAYGRSPSILTENISINIAEKVETQGAVLGLVC